VRHFAKQIIHPIASLKVSLCREPAILHERSCAVAGFFRVNGEELTRSGGCGAAAGILPGWMDFGGGGDWVWVMDPADGRRAAGSAPRRANEFALESREVRRRGLPQHDRPMCTRAELAPGPVR
jgi:hypothetical protein